MQGCTLSMMLMQVCMQGWHKNKKKDIIIFDQSKKLDIFKRLRKRDNFNKKLYREFKVKYEKFSSDLKPEMEDIKIYSLIYNI